MPLSHAGEFLEEVPVFETVLFGGEEGLRGIAFAVEGVRMNRIGGGR